MSKKSNTSKRCTAAFERDAVAPVHSSGKTVTEVAREIGGRFGDRHALHVMRHREQVDGRR
ncbi:hypothetical protein [Streptomyces prasinopilosus]|uniref:Transposase n=1 Tax=Streptomyces prasinopilosus TaxID=67344 RepID=A0A1G6M5K0_9ACTN|nr:hypothetical protein [Streptomyces prasinopilosus]SDC50711.1 hypothetical protein SAMN05216505_102381 [Streptomyces prasinopilosus]